MRDKKTTTYYLVVFFSYVLLLLGALTLLSGKVGRGARTVRGPVTVVYGILCLFSGGWILWHTTWKLPRVDEHTTRLLPLEPFQEVREGRVVRLEIVGDAYFNGRRAVSTFEPRVSLHFKAPLGVGLCVRELRAADLLRGLFGEGSRDRVGTRAGLLGRSFWVEADERDFARRLLSSHVIEQLRNFQKNCYLKIGRPNHIEVYDDRVVYREGPFAWSGTMSEPLRGDVNLVIEKLMEVAANLESTRWESGKT